VAINRLHGIQGIKIPKGKLNLSTKTRKSMTMNQWQKCARKSCRRALQRKNKLLNNTKTKIVYFTSLMW